MKFVSVLYRISFAVWCCRAFSKVFSFTEHLKSEASIINAADEKRSSFIEMWIVIEARGKSDKGRMSNGKVLPSLSFNLIASTRHGRVFVVTGWNHDDQDWTMNAILFLAFRSKNIQVVWKKITFLKEILVCRPIFHHHLPLLLLLLLLIPSSPAMTLARLQ